MHALEQGTPNSTKHSLYISCKPTSNLCRARAWSTTNCQSSMVYFTEWGEANKSKGPIRKEIEMVSKAWRHPPPLCQTGGNTWFFQEDCIKLFREVNPAKLVRAMQKGTLFSIHSKQSLFHFKFPVVLTSGCSCLDWRTLIVTMSLSSYLCSNRTRVNCNICKLTSQNTNQDSPKTCIAG